MRAKRGTELGIHKLLAIYQTGGYKFRPMSGWNGKIRSQPFVYEHTHLIHSSVTTKGHGRSTVSYRYKSTTRGHEKTHTRVFFNLFFVVHFVAKRYILEQKCQKGRIGTLMLGSRWNNF